MNEIEISLKDLWSLFVRRLKWIALAVVAAIVVAVIVTLGFITPKYTSSVTMLATSYGERANASVTYNEIIASQNLIKSYSSLIKSTRVLTGVAAKLDNEFTVGQLKGMITSHGIEETQIIVVDVETTDPELSARVGNALADVLPKEVASWEMGGKIEVIDRAEVPSGRSSPNLTVNVVLAIMISAVLTYLGFFIFERLDTVLHDEEQLRRTFEVPILGTIPPLDSEGNTYGAYGGEEK